MAAMLKDAGAERVIFIGEGMGDNPRFWAEGSPVSLPNSKLRVKPSWGFQDWTDHAPIWTGASGQMSYGAQEKDLVAAGYRNSTHF